MSRPVHFLSIAGPKDQMLQVQEFIDMAQETEIAHFTKMDKLSDYAFLLVYPKNLEPRLERIRLLSKEFPEVTFNYYMAEETLVIRDTGVRSEH